MEQPCSVKAEVRGHCSIGAFSYIDQQSEISKVTIGRYCSIARNVLIGPTSHPTDWLSSHLFVFTRGGPLARSSQYQRIRRPRRFSEQARSTSIGNDVWIGANAVIRRGVKVGDGAIIGAGAVVVKDVQPYEIVGGVPARHIRFRFEPAVIARLEELQWWNYDMSSPALDGINYAKMRRALPRLESLIRSGALTVLAPDVQHYDRQSVTRARDEDAFDEEDEAGAMAETDAAAPLAAVPEAAQSLTPAPLPAPVPAPPARPADRRSLRAALRKLLDKIARRLED